MTTRNYRINDRIRVSKVTLVTEDTDETPKVMDTKEAYRMAMEAGLDLVEVAPNQKPPVCRILDYGKLRYQLAKKEKNSKRNSAGAGQMREIRLTPQISENDLRSKMTIVADMLSSGSKVKIVVVLRGRMITRPVMGFDLLKKALKILRPVYKIDREPTLEKRAVSMILVRLAKGDKPPVIDDDKLAE